MVDQDVSAGRVRIQVLGRRRDCDLLLRRRDRELVMQDWRTARHNDQDLLLRSESGSFDGDGVLAERDGVEMELAIGAGLGRQCVGRIAGL